VGHLATQLYSGQVLVTGGVGEEDYEASAEVYDPGSNAWVPVGTMNQARTYHTATRLPTGQVLVTGGQDFNGVHKGVVRFSP
jgi:hypothetical protein